MAYIQRHLQESVLQLSGEYPVILICGPRDAGKTTLFKMLIDMEKALPAGALGRESRIPGLAAPSDAPREVVTLDDLAQREIAVNDPELFLQMHQPPVLISEVQYAPELLPFIKKTVD